MLAIDSFPLDELREVCRVIALLKRVIICALLLAWDERTLLVALDHVFHSAIDSDRVRLQQSLDGVC